MHCQILGAFKPPLSIILLLLWQTSYGFLYHGVFFHQKVVPEQTYNTLILRSKSMVHPHHISCNPAHQYTSSQKVRKCFEERVF